jgi:structural maintenance of chromosome 2
VTLQATLQATLQVVPPYASEEILPTIEKLRKERGDYMKWAAGNDSLERLRRFCVAYEYTRARQAVDDRGEGEAEVREKLEDLEAKAGVHIYSSAFCLAKNTTVSYF